MAKVGIIMGSMSDLPIMQEAAEILKDLEIAYELNIISAHRTPELMFEYAKNAHKRGVNVIIAGAGGAAHLPGYDRITYCAACDRRSHQIGQLH